jgi:hypothetical protein
MEPNSILAVIAGVAATSPGWCGVCWSRRFNSSFCSSTPGGRVSGARVQLIQELERTRDETLRCFSFGPAELARSYAPGKWSVAYILHHLADNESVFLDRIHRVLSEPRPVLWVMDQDAWAQGLDYLHMPLDISRQVYEAVRNAIIYHAGVHYERSSQLEWVHSVDDVRTLRDEFDKVAAHNEHHLSQIRLALGRPVT